MSSAKFALVRIPTHLSFDDLHLTLNEDNGAMEFDLAPLREILEANADLTLHAEADILELVSSWYGYLRLDGYRHVVAEQWLTNCGAQQAFGIDRMLAGPDVAH